MKTQEYFSALALKLGKDGKPASAYKMARTLRISDTLMSKYVRGLNIPGPVVAFRVAELLGDQPAAVVADFEAERAERDGKDDDADYFRAALTTMRKVVSVAGASILLSVAGGTFSNADAGMTKLSTGATECTS